LRAPYGTPAISPEARWSIENAIGEATRSIGLKGALVKLSAINGAAISKKTLNEKVGVFGGVSVLGTTGFVEPWNECLVGSAENLAETADRVALTTGRTGFKYAKMYFPDHITLIAGSNLERVFQKAEGKETIIIGLPALILKWAKPDILNEMKADTVQELFDRDPYAEGITVALTALKTRTKARIIIIDRAGKIIRDIG
jgi:cobalt-precorrin-5B (C1)-methyltransferase